MVVLVKEDNQGMEEEYEEQMGERAEKLPAEFVK